MPQAENGRVVFKMKLWGIISGDDVSYYYSDEHSDMDAHGWVFIKDFEYETEVPGRAYLVPGAVKALQEQLRLARVEAANKEASIKTQIENLLAITNES